MSLVTIQRNAMQQTHTHTRTHTKSERERERNPPELQHVGMCMMLSLTLTVSAQQGVSIWPQEFRLRRGPEVALSEVRGAIHRKLMKMTCPAMSMMASWHIDFVKDIQSSIIMYNHV